MRYNVELEYWYCFIVDANSEEEAIEKARGLELDDAISWGEERPKVKELDEE